MRTGINTITAPITAPELMIIGVQSKGCDTLTLFALQFRYSLLSM